MSSLTLLERGLALAHIEAVNKFPNGIAIASYTTHCLEDPDTGRLSIPNCTVMGAPRDSDGHNPCFELSTTYLPQSQSWDIKGFRNFNLPGHVANMLLEQELIRDPDYARLVLDNQKQGLQKLGAHWSMNELIDQFLSYPKPSLPYVSENLRLFTLFREMVVPFVAYLEVLNGRLDELIKLGLDTLGFFQTTRIILKCFPVESQPAGLIATVSRTISIPSKLLYSPAVIVDDCFGRNVNPIDFFDLSSLSPQHKLAALLAYHIYNSTRPKLRWRFDFDVEEIEK